MAKSTPGVTTVIEVPPISIGLLNIVLVGDSPLITHRWSDKAKGMLLGKQMKQAKQAKQAKDPEEDFRESMHLLPDGRPGFPCVGFKAAAVSACRFTDGIKMTEARGAFHVVGELAPIESPPPVMREDMVRIGMGVADIRYRAEFRDWKVPLTIRYNRGALSPAQIVNLFNIAGFGVGVGEWRPERDGSYGMFHVEREAGR